MVVKSKESSGRLGGGISADKISYQLSPQPLRKGHSIPGDLNTTLNFRSQHLGQWKDARDKTHSCHTMVMTPSLRGHHLTNGRVSRPSTLPPQPRADLGLSPLRLCQDCHSSSFSSAQRCFLPSTTPGADFRSAPQ